MNRISADPSSYGVDGARPDVVVFHGSHSPSVGINFWPARLQCPVTRTPVVDAVFEGVGVLWSWTFVHLPWPGAVSPARDGAAGYGVGYVDLDAGPRMAAVLVGDQGDWACGARVRAEPLVFRREADGDVWIPAFREVGS